MTDDEKRARLEQVRYEIANLPRGAHMRDCLALVDEMYRLKFELEQSAKVQTQAEKVANT